jgi:hypothetical protein
MLGIGYSGVIVPAPRDLIMDVAVDEEEADVSEDDQEDDKLLDEEVHDDYETDL